MYKVSPDRRRESYTYCNSVGLGLAIWNDADSYDDIKHIASSIGDASGVYTALNNADGHDCALKADCDAKLIFRQTADGPREYFQRSPAFLYRYNVYQFDRKTAKK